MPNYKKLDFVQLFLTMHRRHTWAGHKSKLYKGEEEGITVALFYLILLQEDECVQLLICITHHMNTLIDCVAIHVLLCYVYHAYTNIQTTHTVMLYSHAFCVS